MSYMKFAKYQRGQCVKSIKSAVQDTKVDFVRIPRKKDLFSQETRFMDDTFTLDEVEEVIEAVTEVKFKRESVEPCNLYPRQ